MTGKTTTVRTLGTLLAPSSGTATVAGIPLAAENGGEIRLIRGPDVLAQVVFTPLITVWSIWLGIALLVADRIGWRVTSAMFDRERLITGGRGG